MVFTSGKQKISVCGEIFDFPLFIYPFADEKRFLCVYDDDTAVLVFIVDFNAAITNVTDSHGWPPNDYTRNYETKPRHSPDACNRKLVRFGHPGRHGKRRLQRKAGRYNRLGAYG